MYICIIVSTSRLCIHDLFQRYHDWAGDMLKHLNPLGNDCYIAMENDHRNSGNYPLAICYIVIENDHRNSGFSH